MSAEAVVYALLTGAGPVTAIVGAGAAARIYPAVLPQSVKPTPAAIVYSLVSAVPLPVMDTTSPTHLTRSRVQVDLLGADFAQLRTLRDAVVTALRFQRGLIATFQVIATWLDLEGPVTFDDQLGLWHRPVDFLLLHQH